MPLTDAVLRYFGAERATALLLVCIAVVAFELAATCWRKGNTSQARAAAVALALVAAVQLGVGLADFVSAPREKAQVLAMAQARQRPAPEAEITRMQGVQRALEVQRWVLAGALLVALLLAVTGRSGTVWRGLGLGLAPQTALLLLLTEWSAQRADGYLTLLLSL